MKTFTNLKIGFILLAFLAGTPTYASPLDPVEFQIVLDVVWDGYSEEAGSLGAGSTTDTWKMRVKFFDATVAEENCGSEFCSATIAVSERTNSNFSVMVESTTNPDENHPALLYDSLRSFDTFDYLSDVNNNSEHFKFKDSTNGHYMLGGATRLQTWVLNRSFSSADLEAGTIPRTSDGLVNYLSNNPAGLQVEEFFLNSMAQAAYRKTGTATVRSVQVVTDDNNPIPAECRYEVFSEWDEGFATLVYLKNVSEYPIDGWRINIEFSDAVQITDFWNSSFTGISPFFVANDLDWNSYVYAGQEVVFGFVASKAASQSTDMVLESIICR